MHHYARFLQIGQTDRQTDTHYTHIYIHWCMESRQLYSYVFVLNRSTYVSTDGTTTHHSFVISSQALHDIGTLLVPQKHITTIASTDNIFTFWTIEIHPLDCNYTETYTYILNNISILGIGCTTQLQSYNCSNHVYFT